MGEGINMTVMGLIEELQRCDPQSVIVMSSDEEGNEMHSLYSIEATHGAVYLWPGYEKAPSNK